MLILLIEVVFGVWHVSVYDIDTTHIIIFMSFFKIITDVMLVTILSFVVPTLLIEGVSDTTLTYIIT